MEGYKAVIDQILIYIVLILIAVFFLNGRMMRRCISVVKILFMKVVAIVGFLYLMKEQNR